MSNDTIKEMQESLFEMHSYSVGNTMVLERRPVLVCGSTDKRRPRRFGFSLVVGVQPNGQPIAIQGELTGANTLVQALKMLPDALAKGGKEMQEAQEQARREKPRIIVPGVTVPGVTVGKFGVTQ